jgi:hypothetical protein
VDDELSVLDFAGDALASDDVEDEDVVDADEEDEDDEESLFDCPFRP